MYKYIVLLISMLCLVACAPSYEELCEKRTKIETELVLWANCRSSFAQTSNMIQKIRELDKITAEIEKHYPAKCQQELEENKPKVVKTYDSFIITSDGYVIEADKRTYFYEGYEYGRRCSCLFDDLSVLYEDYDLNAVHELVATYPRCFTPVKAWTLGVLCNKPEKLPEGYTYSGMHKIRFSGSYKKYYAHAKQLFMFQTYQEPKPKYLDIGEDYELVE